VCLDVNAVNGDKTLACDEFLDEPVVAVDAIYNKKCTFSYVEFEAFDNVNFSAPLVKEIDYNGDVKRRDVSDKIETVEFVSSRFPHLPRDLFVEFPQLKSVSCDAANLVSLSPAELRMSTNLEEFSSNSNYIKSLENNLFSASKQLHTLDLSINDIERIDALAFAGLKSLKKLSLDDNKLANLSRDVFMDLISLEEINLSSNQLELVDEKLFQNCKLLSYIYLNDNRIQQISDKSLLHITGINFLELSNNQLEELSLNISASALYANQNRLRSVALNSVGYLSFYNNSIRALSFVHKEGVISLNVSTNKLDLDSLRGLAELSGVQSLDLSFNRLGNLNVSTFLGMPQLKILNLQSTGLTEIGFGLFTHQQALEQLDLSYNNLSSFEFIKLTSAKALTTLFVEGNGITSLGYENLKSTLPALKLLGFSDNPWPCSHLSAFISFLERNQIEIYNLVVEKTKSNVAGIGCSEDGTARHEDKSLSVNPIKHHQLLADSSEMKAISERFEAIQRHVNETREKFVARSELISELSVMKSAIADVRQSMRPWRGDNLTIGDVHKIINETLLLTHHKSDDDEKIIGLKTKVNTMEQSMDKIKDQLRAMTKTNTELEAQYAKLRSEAHPTESVSKSPSTSEDVASKLMITIIFFIVCGFTIIYAARTLSMRRARMFVARRAFSETESINENIL
jgi:Leucine-rich repeat (LRR) protein